MLTHVRRRSAVKLCSEPRGTFNSALSCASARPVNVRPGKHPFYLALSFAPPCRLQCLGEDRRPPSPLSSLPRLAQQDSEAVEFPNCATVTPFPASLCLPHVVVALQLVSCRPCSGTLSQRFVRTSFSQRHLQEDLDFFFRCSYSLHQPLSWLLPRTLIVVTVSIKKFAFSSVLASCKSTPGLWSIRAGALLKTDSSHTEACYILGIAAFDACS